MRCSVICSSFAMSVTFILALLLQTVECNQFVQSRITGATPTTRNSNNCSNKKIADDLNQEDFINMLTNPCRYDKFSRPNSNSGPTKISVKIDIKQIEILNQLQFKINIDAQYCYQDERLRYNESSPKRGETTGGSKLLDKIWMPHIVLNDERDTSVLEIASKDVFISISPLGNVAYSFCLSAKIYCWMDLVKFPFDQQICEVHFKSWSFNTSQLILNWAEENPVNINRELRLAEFEMIKNWTSNSTVPSSTIRGTKGYCYSVLIFKFQLSREIGFYILDYFLPSIMLVCISWVTFWLQADNAAPRMTLGTSTMLTFITLTSGENKRIPKVSSINASAVWFIGCAIFIFASIAEFAFVNIIWRRMDKVELKKASTKYILKSAITPNLARKGLYMNSNKPGMPKALSLSNLDILCNSEAKNNNYLTTHEDSCGLQPTVTERDDNFNQHNDSYTPVAITTSGDDEEGPQRRRRSIWTTTMTPQEIAIWIDNRSRLVFPLAFLFFNIIYWTLVTTL